jgi:hypothetical protein
MRRIFIGRLSATAAAVAALSAGCATGTASSVSTPGPSASSGGQVEASPCQPPTETTTITLTEADNGRTVCARISQRIEIYLHGTQANPWSPITAGGAQLRSAASGKLSLQVGVTGAVFTTVAAGQVDVVSSRPMCSPSSAGSGCSGTAEFRVTVSVRG